jgi:DNA adenine methylase
VPGLQGAVSKPFVKAAGGKTQLVPIILEHVPAFTGRYHEPFVGGGAVFLALYQTLRSSPRIDQVWADLNDVNDELMNAYAQIAHRTQEVIRGLQAIKHNKETYYAIRAKEETTTMAKAVRFLYLNKTCFNGLYRVNKAGKFNVPIGSYVNPTIVEPKVMEYWREALKGAELHSEDFMYRLSSVKAGDFVYADPPYMPRSKTANFTSYTADKFDEKDHERLAQSLAGVHKRGGKFLCSQGDSEKVRELYKAFTIIPVTAKHMVGAAAKSRTTVNELLIKNF